MRFDSPRTPPESPFADSDTSSCTASLGDDDSVRSLDTSSTGSLRSFIVSDSHVDSVYSSELRDSAISICGEGPEDREIASALYGDL